MSVGGHERSGIFAKARYLALAWLFERDNYGKVPDRSVENDDEEMKKLKIRRNK